MNKEYYIIHGSNKFTVKLSKDDNVLADLSQHIEQHTGVPVSRQKLICKGKSLTPLSASLDSLNLKSKSKIMLIGKKKDDVETALINEIESVDKASCACWERFASIREEVCGVGGGFLDQPKSLESLEKLKVKVKTIAEEIMRYFEKLDSMELDANFVEARDKRKSVITKLNTYLDTTDKEEERINELYANL